MNVVKIIRIFILTMRLNLGDKILTSELVEISAVYCTMEGFTRAAESVAAQQRRCELSKGLVSRARMLYANSESNREPERARASKREPERAGEQARESQREAGLTS